MTLNPQTFKSWAEQNAPTLHSLPNVGSYLVKIKPKYGDTDRQFDGKLSTVSQAVFLVFNACLHETIEESGITDADYGIAINGSLTVRVAKIPQNKSDLDMYAAFKRNHALHVSNCDVQRWEAILLDARKKLVALVGEESIPEIQVERVSIEDSVVF